MRKEGTERKTRCTFFKKFVELGGELLPHVIFWGIVLQKGQYVISESPRFCIASVMTIRSAKLADYYGRC